MDGSRGCLDDDLGRDPDVRGLRDRPLQLVRPTAVPERDLLGANSSLDSARVTSDVGSNDLAAVEPDCVGPLDRP